MATVRPPVFMTTGTAGSGKSYIRCARFMVDEFLPNETGVHFSNFPLFADEISTAVSEKTGQEFAAVRDRIRTIPDEVLKLWMREESGPWDYFQDLDIQGAHIAIDEVHNFAGEHHSARHKGRWAEWLGEIRHRGATVELLSQDPDKIAKRIHLECAMRLQLTNSETRRDPFLKIPLADWYELRAAWITGRYTAAVWVAEQRKVHRYWTTEEERLFWITPEYFKYYDSYSTPAKGGVKAEAPLREWQKRNRVSLLWWFFKRYPIRILSRVALVAFVVWFTILGGLVQCLGYMQYELANIAKSSVSGAAAISTTEAEQGGLPTVSHSPPVPITNEDGSGLQARIAQLEGQVSRMRDLLLEAEFQIKELTNELGDAFALQLLFPEGVTFRNGYTYRIGDKIDFGPYAGRELVMVDFPRRVARLDNGILLRLGTPERVSDDTAKDRPHPDVQGSVPGTAGQSRAAQPRPYQQLPPGNVERGSYAPPGVSPYAE